MIYVYGIPYRRSTMTEFKELWLCLIALKTLISDCVAYNTSKMAALTFALCTTGEAKNDQVCIMDCLCVFSRHCCAIVWTSDLCFCLGHTELTHICVSYGYMRMKSFGLYQFISYHLLAAAIVRDNGNFKDSCNMIKRCHKHSIIELTYM